MTSPHLTHTGKVSACMSVYRVVLVCVSPLFLQSCSWRPRPKPKPNMIVTTETANTTEIYTHTSRITSQTTSKRVLVCDEMISTHQHNFLSLPQVHVDVQMKRSRTVWCFCRCVCDGTSDNTFTCTLLMKIRVLTLYNHTFTPLASQKTLNKDLLDFRLQHQDMIRFFIHFSINTIQHV